MWFKNLSLFRLPEDFALPENLDDKLAEHVLTPIGKVELSARGFVPVLGGDAVGLTHNLSGATLMCLGSEDKILPAGVIRDEVNKRVAALQENSGRNLGKRQREQIKDEVIGELVGRAFVKTGRTYGYLDLSQRVLIVNSSSDKAAEALIGKLREAVGTFAVEPVATEQSLAVIMSEWLKQGSAANGFVLGDEAELRDPVETKTTVKVKRHDLTLDEVKDHVLSGKQVSQLGLIFDDRLGFTLDDKLKVRKLKFLDLVLDEIKDTSGEDAAAEFDARFALMTLEVRRLLDALHQAFTLQ